MGSDNERMQAAREESRFNPRSRMGSDGTA